MPLRNHTTFFGDDVSPMKLCDICKGLNMTKLLEVRSDYPYENRQQGLMHQKNYLTMKAAASSGCELCTLVSQSLRDNYERDHHCAMCDLASQCPEFARDHQCTVQNADSIFERASGSDDPACRIHVPRVPISSDTEAVEWIIFRLPHDWRNTSSQMGLDNSGTSVILRLKALPGSSSSHEGGLFLRELGRCPDFDWARSRIRSCGRDHARCSLQETPFLPTRSIDVGPQDGSMEPHLVCSAKDRGRYVALSHCWGKLYPLRTTKDNIQQHRKELKMSLLPRTFRDAVIATRRLGFRYLWIDSLCIIQEEEDHADWNREYPKMTDIYRNAEITLGCLFAADSSVGFLQERTCMSPPRVWEYTNSKDSTPKRVTVHETDCSLWPPSVSSPGVEGTRLESRAWVLQERLLSRRTLYFFEEKMMFECVTHTWFDDELYPVAEPWAVLDNPFEKKGLKKAEFAEGVSKQEIKTWYETVERYTARKLTKPSDTLPAISGLARIYWQGKEKNYVAGLLQHDLLHGLSWYVNVNGEKRGEKRCETCPNIPSWSWASTNYGIKFDIPDQAHYMAAKPGESIDEWTEDVSKRIKLKILDLQASFANEDQFGDVQSGNLTVEGRVRVLKPDADPRYYNFFLDNPERPISEGSTTELLCLAVDTVGHGWGALVLQPVTHWTLPKPQIAENSHGQGGTWDSRTWGDGIPSYERNISIEGVKFKRAGYWQCTGDKQFRTPHCNPFWDAPVRKVVII